MVIGKKNHAVDTIFVLALFLMFALSSLMLVMIGAKVYQNITVSMDNNYDMRTSLTYVSSKVRQGDQNGSVQVRDNGGIATLVIKEIYDGEPYETSIYFYDGAIRELLLAKDAEFQPDYGTPVIELSDFTISQDPGGLLRLSALNDKGIRMGMQVAVRLEG